MQQETHFVFGLTRQDHIFVLKYSFLYENMEKCNYHQAFIIRINKIIGPNFDMKFLQGNYIYKLKLISYQLRRLIIIFQLIYKYKIMAFHRHY